jgi:hypothetical protein
LTCAQKISCAERFEEWILGERQVEERCESILRRVRERIRVLELKLDALRR